MQKQKTEHSSSSATGLYPVTSQVKSAHIEVTTEHI